MHMTPARMAQAALQVACVLRTPNMQHWAGVLAQDMLCAPGYERPTGSRLQSAVERQGVPALPHAPELLVSEAQFYEPHLAAAMRLAHPLAELAVQATPALRAAVGYVASFRGEPDPAAAIRYDREERWQRFAEARRGLAEERLVLDRIRCAFCEPNVAMEAPEVDMAITACCILAGQWPDAEYTLCQVVGFPCMGDYKDSGVFRSVEQPATLRPGQLSNEGHIADVVRQLDATARSAIAQYDHGQPERVQMLETITRKTREEVHPPRLPDGSSKPKTASGPWTKDEVDGLLGPGAWRPLLRFAIPQGFLSGRLGQMAQLRQCALEPHERNAELP